MFFIVKGRGTLRYGDERRPIRAGDVICCPTGGPESAHQIVNDSHQDAGGSLRIPGLRENRCLRRDSAPHDAHRA
jgi:uncharacterized cupin superfamily protein